MFWLVLASVVLTAAYAAHRLALRLERRGWIYYRNSQRPRGVGLGLLAPIYNPALEHVVEEESSQRARADQDASGDGNDEWLLPDTR